MRRAALSCSSSSLRSARRCRLWRGGGADRDARDRQGELRPPTETTETETTETETTGTRDERRRRRPTTTETTPAAEGDPVAGKEVFLGASGCTGCHTLADAGSTGTVGPNLDDAKPSFDLVVGPRDERAGGHALVPRGSLTEQQIADVAAYVSSVAGSCTPLRRPSSAATLSRLRS